jgi:hypothetical protein
MRPACLGPIRPARMGGPGLHCPESVIYAQLCTYVHCAKRMRAALPCTRARQLYIARCSFDPMLL